MPTSNFFQIVMNTTLPSIHPYPPPVVVKHYMWYYHDANLFIIIRGIVYGLHRQIFEKSDTFLTTHEIEEPGYDTLRGATPLLPIPLNDLETRLFDNFLNYVYYPEYFTGSENDLLEIRGLCITWGFYDLSATTLIEVLNRRRRHLPLTMRPPLFPSLVYEIIDRQRRRNRRYELIVEDDDSD
jgi:hypothetical protein